MKQIVRVKESEFKRMIAESVKRVINEMSNDYEGNDLDYESIKMQAEDIIPKMTENGETISWRSVAENMGFRLETLNGDDLELLKDAIEEVMAEEENPYWEEDADFENDFEDIPYANESLNRRIGRIVSECIRRNTR